MSRLGLCTLPLCAAHCRHAGSPPPGSRGRERGGRRAPHSSSAASPGTCPAGSARSPASASSHPTGWPWWPLPLAEREGMSKDVSTLRRGMGIRDITQVFEVVQGRCLSSGTTSAWQARLLSLQGLWVCPGQGRSAPQGQGVSTSRGVPSPQAWHQPVRENPYPKGTGLGQVPFPQGGSQPGREDPSPQGMHPGEGPCPLVLRDSVSLAEETLLLRADPSSQSTSPGAIPFSSRTVSA